jgi:hypothetical protein
MYFGQGTLLSSTSHTDQCQGGIVFWQPKYSNDDDEYNDDKLEKEQQHPSRGDDAREREREL